jgi:hypothetical protein
MSPIVLALALLAAAPENPADLADRLGSADAGVREEAEGALEEIGRPALPTLRIAVGKASNPAHARRLADLIDLIERKRLLLATKVELVEHGITVSDAVADLSRRARLRVALEPPDDAHWTTKTIDFDSKGPIGFWEAIDRLGALGGFRLETGMAPGPRGPSRPSASSGPTTRRRRPVTPAPIGSTSSA